MELNDIIITKELVTRKNRPPNVFAGRRALNLIARRMDYGREAVLQALCEQAMELCAADSAGISVLHGANRDFNFTWDAVTGQLQSHLSDKVLFDSPCGTCIELGSPQLFSYPERYFKWMQQVSFPVVEALIIPLHDRDHTPLGTVWIMFHDKGRTFNSEDARIMTIIGGHAATAIQMLSVRE